MNVETLFRVAALNTAYAAASMPTAGGMARLFLEQCHYKITTADNHRRAMRPAWSTPTRARC